MNTKVELLAEQFGFSDPVEMIESYFFDGIMPGICQNLTCDYSTEYEPDQSRGWCENCCTNTVVSAAVLEGII